MTVGLFIPCYIDQFYPQAAIATLRLLQRLGVTVEYPQGPVCCGQPMANSGYGHLTKGCDDLFTGSYSSYDYVVSPSGSCVLHIKEHMHPMHGKIYELVEFLTDVLKVDQLDARFPHKVSIHQSCHGLRGLYLSQMSERMAPAFSKPERLLKMVDGLELIDLHRSDECCGFGGTFCVSEEAVSVKMGKDRVKDHETSGAEYITSSDLSCLMHMEGLLKRSKSPVKVIHIAEILNHTEHGAQ
ncbi:MAG: (Fe-S)-binding protein [Bacteroidetes bacterium]|nr:(Fe-S)-binding protein [Bacteroidota bacterium]